MEKAKVALKLLLSHYKERAETYNRGVIGLTPAAAYEACAQDLAWILKLLEEEEKKKGDQA